MSKNKTPDTSVAAYRQAKEGLIDRHKDKILAAFERLGSATADQIAEYTGMDHAQINRRFVDLARDQKIYNTKLKKPTRRGRNAFVWTLNAAGAKTEREQKQVTYKPEVKNASDYARELIKNCQQSKINFGEWQ